ncbi:MAG: Gfo/Idh/MocA family oxidoreductase [Acidobacteriia bacterium]|nr:Gfo/Idh/MocA family oxidoreductase [Terriglobia bacterium]
MRFAVLGLGFMGSTHLKALRAIPGVEVVAVCSVDERALTGDLSGIQGNIGGPGERLDFTHIRKYRDIEFVFEDPDVDAVDICLPTNLHGAAAIGALRAGKHVLVEKPMALDGATADSMVSAAEDHGRILMAAQVVRFLPAYTALREVVKRGELGSVRTALFRRRCAAPAWGGWLTDPAQSGGGIFDLLIHDVDYCLHLFGRPEALLAAGYEDLASGIDCVDAQLFYPHGVVAVSGGWHNRGAYPFSAEYTVVLERGAVEYNPATPAPVLYGPGKDCRALPISGQDGYAAEVEYFVECCLDGCPPELCPPAESADAVKLMRLIMEARARKGKIIECRI